MIFLIIMIFIALMTMKKNITIAISSLMIGIVCLLLTMIEEPLALSFSILVWVSLIVLQYKEKWEKNLLIFIVIGILTSILLAYTQSIQILIVLIFFLITKLLNII